MTWDGLVQRNGKYCSIHCMECSEFQTGIFGRMESAHKLSIIDSTPENSFCSGTFRVENASLAL